MYKLSIRFDTSVSFPSIRLVVEMIETVDRHSRDNRARKIMKVLGRYVDVYCVDKWQTDLEHRTVAIVF